MKSRHVPEHLVLKLTMEDRDFLLNVLSRIKEPRNFVIKLKKALFEGKDLELQENEALPW